MSRPRLIRFLILSGVFTLLHLIFYGKEAEVIAFSGGVLKISDFSHYLVMVRAFWFDGHRGFYNLDENFLILSQLVGTRIAGIMPLALTPAALLLFLPFAWLAGFGFHVAKAAWFGISIAAALTSLLSLRHDSMRLSRSGSIRLLVAALIFFGSNAFFTTLWLGQTSLVFLASMLVLFRSVRNGERNVDGYPLAALFFVGLKPTYFGLAVLLLVTYRAWRLVGIAAGFLFFSCALMTVLSGTAWFLEYWEMFSVFSRAKLAPHFQAPFAFDRMNVFRSAWPGFAADETLLAISKGVLLLAILGAAVSIGRELLQGRAAPERTGLLRFLLLTAAYFLFSPYLSTYEDLFLLFPVLLLAVAFPKRLDSTAFLAVLLLLFCGLNFLTLLEFVPRQLLWLLKAGFFALIAYLIANRPSAEA